MGSLPRCVAHEIGRACTGDPDPHALESLDHPHLVVMIIIINPHLPPLGEIHASGIERRPHPHPCAIGRPILQQVPTGLAYVAVGDPDYLGTLNRYELLSAKDIPQGNKELHSFGSGLAVLPRE